MPLLSILMEHTTFPHLSSFKEQVSLGGAVLGMTETNQEEEPRMACQGKPLKLLWI
jgi:hypothetical protein